MGPFKWLFQQTVTGAEEDPTIKMPIEMPGWREHCIIHFSVCIALLMAWQSTALEWRKPNTVTGPHRSKMAASWCLLCRWPDEGSQKGIWSSQINRPVVWILSQPVPRNTELCIQTPIQSCLTQIQDDQHSLTFPLLTSLMGQSTAHYSMVGQGIHYGCVSI